MLPTRGVKQSLRLPPEGLGQDVLLVAEVAAAAGERLGLVEASQAAQLPAQARREGRENRQVFPLLERVARPPIVLGGSLVEARQLPDPCELQRTAPSALLACSFVRLPRECPRLVEAVERREEDRTPSLRTPGVGCSGRSSSSLRSASSVGTDPSTSALSRPKRCERCSPARRE